MSVLQQIRRLIVNQDIDYPVSTPPSIIRNHKICWVENYNKILSFLAVGLVGYILYPTIKLSITGQNEMFNKRPDKYTTGLINMRNDCFANSSIQAYSALPGLVSYINELVSSYVQLKELIRSYDLSPDLYLSEEDKKDSKKVRSSKFEIPLHYSMASMMNKLQETRLSSKTISVWSVLHTLESIFNAKISKSQHDAHELTQLINETLESENQKVIKKHEEIMKELSSGGLDLSQMDPINIPEFPLNGLILTQMKCLKCSHVSKPSFSPFLMLTLNTPQVLSANLSSMLEEARSETIEGYQCVKCRISTIAVNEERLHSNGTPQRSEEKSIIDSLLDLNKKDNLFINEDLPKEIESYIKDYKKGDVDISNVTTTIVRKSQILKPPKVFGIHLSRSTFDGFSVSRNSCRVSFKDHLNLSIGKEYSDELKNFKKIALEENVLTESRLSKVLTDDVNDMIDEAAQREDVEETGEDLEEQEEESDGTSSKKLDVNESDSELNDEALESDSFSSDEDSIYPPTSLQVDSSDNTVALERSNSQKSPDTLNNAPISAAQTKNLKMQFKNFNFNDNDVYKYKLKAVVKHFGTHASGHYECYRRKPLFVKDGEGNIIKVFPEISHLALIGDGNNKNDQANQNGNTKSNAVQQSNGSNETNESESSQGIRHRLSMMVNRRPSIIQANLSVEKNIEEGIDSKLTTPTEIIVNSADAEYFKLGAVKNNQGLETQGFPEKEKVRMKKIPSLVKHPFWKISDSQVSEVSTSYVLYDTSTVYMLYFERIDRSRNKK